MTFSDGSVIIDTRINTDGFSRGAANLKSQFKGLGSSIGKLGKVVAAAFAVKTLTEFGKEAVQLGSDLQEVQNVVDVTFTAMRQKVDEFAAAAAKSAGLSETMAKRYVGTFGAMAKSFRFTEGEAYEMATTLTQLAGDVASFYNLTQAEAYTKLKSVFTGETETLKDLGVVMTQAALDDFALRKGLKKTTSQMSEQEKVSLRYQFVLEQLNAASGDFARTSDSWANQTRILSLQFDQLKATIGQGLINVLTPAIKRINELLEKLQNLANDFKTLTEGLFGDSSGGMSDAVGDAADNAGDLSENMQAAEKAAKSMISGFDELNVLSKSTSEQTDNFGEAVDGATPETEIPKGTPEWLTKIKDILSEIAEPLEQIDWQPLKEAALSLWDIIKDLAGSAGSKFLEFWKDFLGPVTENTAEERLPSLLRSVGNALDFVGDVLEVVWPVLKPLLGFLTVLADISLATFAAGLEAVTGVLKILGDFLNPKEATGEFFTKLFEDYTEEESELIKRTNDAAEAFNKLADHTEEEEDAIQAQFNWVQKLWGELNTLADSSGKVDASNRTRAEFILGELNRALDTEYTMVGNMIVGYKDLKEQINGVIAAKKANLLLEAHEDDYRHAIQNKEDAWDRYMLEYEKGRAMLDLMEQMKYDFEHQQVNETLGYIPGHGDLEDLQNAFLTQREVVKTARDEYLKYAAAIAEYETAAALIIAGNYDEAVKLLLGRNTDFTAIDFETEIEREMAAAEAELAEAQRIAGQTKVAFENGIAGYTQGMVDEADAAVKKIEEKLKFLSRGIVLDISGVVFNGQLIYGKPYTLGPTQIPYLASGAVIPPNAPFMAVLGDQRHGKNIEAPLSTIEEAVANVTAEQSERMISAMYEFMDLVAQKSFSVQIGDETIGHANERYTSSRGVHVNTGAFANAY